MRIISRFTDFYDGVQATGHDESLLYVRHTTTLDARAKENTVVVNQIQSNLDRIDSNFQIGVIGFCGKLYVYAQFRNMIDNRDNALIEPRCKEERAFRKYFDLEHLKKAFPEFAKDLNPEGKNSWWRGTFLDKLGEFDKNDDIFLKLGVPVFHYDPNYAIIRDEGNEHFWQHPKKLILNPNLKQLEFYRLVSDYQAFQELEMYLGNVLVGNKEEPQIVDDKVLIASKGFDTKKSFRKPKQEGSKKNRKSKS